MSLVTLLSMLACTFFYFTMMNNRLPVSVMSVYERGKTRVKLSEEFEVTVGMLHASVLSPFLFVVVMVVDVVMQLARDGVLCVLLFSDDLGLICYTIIE